MKQLLLISLFLVIGQYAQASDVDSLCRAGMYDRAHRLFETITVSDYNTQYACQQAQTRCVHRLRNLQSQGKLRGGYCRIIDGQHNPTYTCRNEMVERNRVLFRFQDRGTSKAEACRRVEHNCLQRLRYYQSQGLYRRAFCTRGY